MAQILKLPVHASKLGYRRVKKRARAALDPNQLDLFDREEARILAFHPPDLSAFEFALMADERGDQGAAALYSRAISKEDRVADAYCNLGILESRNGNTAKAFDCFTSCLKHDSRHIEAHYNLANLYFDQDDFRLAQFHFEIAVEIDPSFANAHFNLALVLAINNDPEAAMRALGTYQQLVSEDEGRIAADLLQDLKKSVAAARSARVGSN